MRPRLPILATLLLFALASWAATGIGTAATSGSVVGANVLSATSITNACLHPTARTLGPATVSSSNLTATGANVCRFQFGSSNGLATATIAQRDRVGTAMQRVDPSYATSRAADPGYTAIDVLDTSVAYAGRSDGQIVRTGTDGNTWGVENSGTALPISGISVIDATNAYAVANCGISCPTLLRRTTAGGTNWVTQTVPGGVVSPLYDVAHEVGASNIAIAVGANGTILRTTTDGATWNTVASGVAAHLTSITIYSSTLAYISGASGTLLRSIDRGVSWTPITAPTGADINDHAIAPGPTLFLAVGGAVFRSVNPAGAVPGFTNIGGPGASCTMTSISAPSASDLVLGGNHICNTLHSTDANLATPTFIKRPGSSIGATSEVDATSPTHALMAMSTGAIDRTLTGTSWSTVRVESSRVTAIDQVAPNHVMAVGGDGFVWTSSNAGGSWTTRSTGSTRHIAGLDYVSATEAWASGDSGRVWHTTNGGATWTEFTTGTSVTLNDIRLLRDGTVLVVGQSGYVARSRDGGTTWTTVATGSSEEITEISVDQETGRIWIAGGLLGTSTDDGRTFVNVQPSPVLPAWMVGIAAAGGQSAYAVTSSALYSTTNGGATWNVVPSASFFFASAVESTSPANIQVATVFGTMNSQDGGLTWSYTTGIQRGVLAAVDGNRNWNGGEAGAISVTGAGSPVNDYAPGTWGAGTTMFGACLQAIGANTAAAWLVDAAGIPGQCQASDGDPWNAVPAAPTTLATTTLSGATGSVDLVWGMRVSSNQTAGEYTASIDVEVIAP